MTTRPKKSVFVEVKVCVLCGIEKPRGEFNSNPGTTDRLASQCRPCVRDYKLRREYGISLADYQRLSEEQGGVCKLCGRSETAVSRGTPRVLAVDHCHKTGRVRGLLCDRCNRGLGYFDDDIEHLLAAAAYLR